MKLHILGICGTFMGSLALLAKALGHEVSGADTNIYPPMSTQLAAAGIPLQDGYAPDGLDAQALILIGNALGRGNPSVEYILEQGLGYTSGPQWLAQNVLPGKHVLAVSGTHGKTTTASILAWLLEAAREKPGFVIGGVAENFGVSARLGESRFFVVEADEYDSAFFDKRAKFIHYRPTTLIVNNIEFDHADIFADMASIRREFHHLLRTVPGNGRIIARQGDSEIEEVLCRGCWTPVVSFGAEGEWRAEALREDYSAFRVLRSGEELGVVEWALIGRHNAENALAAIAAGCHVGVAAELACRALGDFRGVKRRLQVLARIGSVTLYDDFAHHPSAIRATLEALRRHVGRGRLIAILEPRSNTMKLGVHKDALAAALAPADQSFFYRPDNLQWDPAAGMAGLGERCQIHEDTQSIIEAVWRMRKAGDHIVIMSNGGFENMQQRLLARLEG